MAIHKNGLKRLTAADELFDILRKSIASGELKSGDKIDTQEQLCEKYLVSRSTVREAISRLQAIGLVSSLPGKGTTVNSPAVGKQMSSLSASLMLDPGSASELLQARFIVERAVIRLIGMHGKDKDFAKLQEHIELQKSALKEKDLPAFGTLDVEFHGILANLSRNSVLSAFLDNISDSLSTFIAEVTSFEGAAKSALEYHTKIVKALTKGNIKQAEKYMEDHLLNVGRRIEKNTNSFLDLAILKELADK